MAQIATQDRTGNHLLDRLPEGKYKRLLPSWEIVALLTAMRSVGQNSSF